MLSKNGLYVSGAGTLSTVQALLLVEEKLEELFKFPNEGSEKLQTKIDFRKKTFLLKFIPLKNDFTNYSIKI